MKKYLSELIDKILSIGIRREYAYTEKYQICHTNIGSIISFTFAIISTIASSFFVPYPYIFIPVIGSFAYLLTLWFNHHAWHLVANGNVWFVSVTMFFWMANAYGEDSNAYLLFIVAEMMSILNFDRKSNWIYFSSILPIILVIITYIGDFSLFLIPNLQANALYGLHIVLFFAVIIGCGVTVWVHRIQVQEKIDLLEEQYDEVEDANNELKKTNEELDRFVYSVSHDLRAPITSVMGLVDLCMTDKENIETYLALQKKSMNRLDNFIKDILHYARNSRLEVLPVDLNIEKMIYEAFENQRFAQSAEDITLKVEIEKKEPFYADEFRLNIILANLISNSIRYRNTKANPSFIQFNIKIQPEMAYITIQDNGIGIPAQHLPNIFQMFYRANAKISGSGLGLYIVKEALIKMGGSISVQSEEGSGTTFTLNIPNTQNTSFLQTELN